MAEQPNPAHDPFEDEDEQSRGQFISEFFHHYWPMVLFGGCFLATFSLPLILAGGGDYLIPALVMLAVFGIALTLTFTFPAILPIFVLLIVGGIFMAAPERLYNKAGFMLSVGILGMATLGGLVFFRKIREGQADKELEPDDALKIAPIETSATSDLEKAAVPSAEEKAAPKGPKPIAFDVGIAAKGVSIIFGTESGNAEGLAEVAQQQLEKDGHPVQVLDAGVIDGRHLKAFANLLIITSTWGEGDPPSNALELVADIKNDELGLDTTGIQFSVCSLGDTSYELFCQCGKDFDSKLEQFGGKRLHARMDCDVDFEQPFDDWLQGVKGALKGGLNTTAEYSQEATPEPVGAA